MRIAAAELRRPQSKRVLIVDDIKEIRKLLREFLEETGFIVCGEASDGLAAVEQAGALKPDLP